MQVSVNSVLLEKVHSPRMFWLLPQIRVEFQADTGETADTLNDDGQVNHLDGDT